MRGLLVGRFQPLHNGHLAAVKAIMTRRPKEPLLLVVGSAEESHTPLNPFTSGERLEMVQRTLHAERIAGVEVYPVPDVRRHAIWVAHLESYLPPFEVVYTNNPLTRVLFEKAKYRVETPELIDRSRFEGVHVRGELLAGRSVDALVPPAVAEYLREIGGAGRLQQISARGPDVTPEHHR
jgi:nicotinamide-nucleotide adenylyltransferase